MRQAFTFILVFLLAGAAMAQKKVAVWETKCSDGSVSAMQMLIVRGGMETAVSNAPGYVGFNRTDFDAILKEHNFQRSGAVSDADIKRMGEMAGVQYIIVPEVSAQGNDFYIIVKMLDIETGQFGAAHQELCSSSAADIKRACAKLGSKVFGMAYTDFALQQKDANTITVNVKGIIFNLKKVEAGSFTMGCSGQSWEGCDLMSKPEHPVTITKDYYIGECEVTQGLYEAVTGTNPSHWKYHDRPVENVSWNDAQEFCRKLNQLSNRTFTLPTEAEWEYAARGGRRSAGTRYSGSSNIADVAWYKANSNQRTNPVGRKKPNELGIYDMNGNVSELCQDYYDDYRAESQIDPTGPAVKNTPVKMRVYRGGSYDGNNSVTYRSYIPEDSKDKSMGFRIVLH